MIFELGSQTILTPEHVGGKAANLNDLYRKGFHIPPGFVGDVSHCFETDDTTFSLYLKSAIRYLAQQTDTAWCDAGLPPLVVSVRSGAPVSMPGMMDTILNVGLCADNLMAFAVAYDADMVFAYDCYRRLIQMYGVTVKNIHPSRFDEIFKAAVLFWGELTETHYKKIVELFEHIYWEETCEPFPQDPGEQLFSACKAVYASWFSDSAISYREMENIPETLGTAVTVQKMVFGNLNDSSATGVVFTHDPNSGAKGWYGEFLTRAQGEDVVAGTHATRPIGDLLHDPVLHHVAFELQQAVGSLYKARRSILDIEFTIENNRLYLLQYREAKCATKASVRSILDMNRDGEITAEEATARFLKMLPELESGTKDPGNLALLGTGLGATEGEVTGVIAIGHASADEYHKSDTPYIYVANATQPDDIEQMKNSVGILTFTGGVLSHAVVVARGWNKCCVVGFSGAKADKDSFTFKGSTYSQGDLIKINGTTGQVWA